MAVEVEWLSDWERIAARADGFLDRDARNTLFDTLDWYRDTSALVHPGDSVSVLHAREGDAQLWLFLKAGSSSREAQALASWYSLAWRPITDATGDMAHRLLVAAARALSRRFDLLSLAPVSASDKAALLRALRASGWWCSASVGTTNWRIDVTDQSFEDYWAKRPARLRNTVIRQERKSSLDIRISNIFDPVLWTAYEEIYAASWKPAEGSPAFLRALAEREGAAGTLRLGIAHTTDGQPVAAQLWLVERRVATIHKLAHREDARAGSPGSILSRALFRHVIDEDRVATISFGLGDEPYKADWMDSAEPVYTIQAWRPLQPRIWARAIQVLAHRLAGRVRRR